MQPQPKYSTPRQHAIVIGASMGGLVAARVLADYYQQVTVLERDSFPTAGEHRKGVPQSRHAHALLPSGRQGLETLFPGLSQALVEQGAILADGIQHGVRFIGGSYHCRFPSGAQSLYVSRTRLEAQVRTRLLALPNVRVIENCNVLGVTTNDDQSRVTGVRLVRRDQSSAEKYIPADLIVDASGRGSHSLVWLEQLGYAKPKEEQVRVNIAYASRIYQRKPEQAQDAYTMLITPVPPNRRMGVMLAIEGDRWHVTLVGYLGDEPPTDPEGFLAFAKTLPTLDIYEAIRQAEPLNDPVPAKYPASIRRYYEKLERFPAGYLVFGDAICGFNPTYGQGMTVAVLEAQLLQQCLAGGDEDLAHRFFTKTGKLVDIPWTITTGGDLRFPEVEGKRSAIKRLIDWYLTKLHRAAQQDPKLVLAFGTVANLRMSPKSLLQPRVAWRVLLGNLPTRLPRTPAGSQQGLLFSHEPFSK